MYKLTINKLDGAVPVAIIKGGKYNGHTVYYYKDVDEKDDKNKIYRDFKQLKLSGGATFSLALPRIDNQRYVISCFAPSGLGKTTFLANVLNYLVENKEYTKDLNNVILFSKKNYEDENAFSNKLKKIIKQVNLDSNLLITEPLDLKEEKYKKEYKDSVVVFDDINTLSTADKRKKQIRNNIMEFRDDLLEVGRYLNSTILLTEHIATAGNDTRIILNETNIFVLFTSMGAGVYDRLLRKYLGFRQKQIDNLYQNIFIDSRYIIFIKIMPYIYMTEHTIGFVKDI